MYKLIIIRAIIRIKLISFLKLRMKNIVWVCRSVPLMEKTNVSHKYVSYIFSVYGGDLTGSSGQVASPNYPNQYPHNVNYVWTITVDIGMRIRVTVNALDIESVANCYFDYLRVGLFVCRFVA